MSEENPELTVAALHLRVAHLQHSVDLMLQLLTEFVKHETGIETLDHIAPTDTPIGDPEKAA